MFEPSPHLRQRAADLWAARDFPAPYAVTLPLNPSIPGHQSRIDVISGWARAVDERLGRSRRTVHPGRSEVIFNFESYVDAVECKLRYG